MIKKLMILIFCLALFGCASGGYVQPEMSSDVAIIKNKSTRNGLTNWEVYVVQTVNDQFISYAKEDWLTWSGPAKAERRYEPGEVQLVIKAEFNKTFGGSGPFLAFVPLKATILPGVVYQLEGKVQGNEVVVWLVDSKSNDVVSPEGRSNYNVMPTSTFTPIFIPAK